MKVLKILITGMLLAAITSLPCFGDDTNTTDILSALTSLTSSTSDGTTDILGAVQSNIDPTLLKNFTTAFAANQASASPSTPEGFLLNYMTEHSEFAQALKDAIDKTKKDKGITSDSDLTKSIVDQLKDLKNQIDHNSNLSDEDKKAYEDLLKKYDDMTKNLQNQISNTNSALNKAMDNLSSPQQTDPMMMIMMIMMMLMMMMKGGSGGGGGAGGCPGGSCGG